MTTPLPGPSFKFAGHHDPRLDTKYYAEAQLKAYGAAEYKRAISDAVEILSDTRENTRYDALQEIRKLGEKS